MNTFEILGPVMVGPSSGLAASPAGKEISRRMRQTQLPGCD